MAPRFIFLSSLYVASLFSVTIACIGFSMSNYVFFKNDSMPTTNTPAEPITAVVFKIFKFNNSDVAVDFTGDILYLGHDFNFLAELKYEKPTDFNRVPVGFFNENK